MASRAVRVQPEPLQPEPLQPEPLRVTMDAQVTPGACVCTRTKIDNRAQATICRLQEAQLSMAGSLTFPNTDKDPAKFAQMPAGLNKPQVDGTNSWFQSVHTPKRGCLGAHPTPRVMRHPPPSPRRCRRHSHQRVEAAARQRSHQRHGRRDGLQYRQAAQGVLSARAQGGGAHHAGPELWQPWH